MKNSKNKLEDVALKVNGLYIGTFSKVWINFIEGVGGIFDMVIENNHHAFFCMSGIKEYEFYNIDKYKYLSLKLEDGKNE